jgi:TonB family protein
VHPGLALAFLLSTPASRAETPAPPPAAEQTAQDLPPLVKDPALLHFVEAPYPEEAQKAGLEASVRLAIEIDEAGRVRDVQILEPVGHGFDEAAVAAARQFQFSPAEDASGPVPVIIEFAYGFVLDAASHQGAVPQASAGPPPEAELPMNLEGQILEMGTRRSLASFSVTLTDLSQTTTTGTDGWFHFRGVPAGTHHLRVAQSGYDTLDRDIDVTSTEVTSVKLWLRSQSYRADTLYGVYTRNKEEITRRTLTMEQVRRVPGTFGDPVRVIQSLPGAARTPFGTGLLVIRGADPQDTAVYVDNIRVPIIYHLAGYESILNSDLIESVDYLPGGYGVQYGRSLGGVVNVNTKHTFPEDHRATWGSDLLDTEALVEGRAGKDRKWGYAAAARRSYIDVFIPLFTGDSGYVIDPRWYDYQVKIDRLGMKSGAFSVFLFGFDDTLGVSTPGDVAQGSDQDTQGNVTTRYGTHRLLVDWEKPLGEKLTWSLTPSLGVDFGNFDVGNDIQATENQYSLELRSELRWQPSDAFRLRPGIDFIGGYFDFDLTVPFNPEFMADYDPIGERESWSWTDDGWIWAPDFYVDAEIRPLKDPEKLMIVPGVRTNCTDLIGGFNGISLDPRIAAKYAPVPSSILKASAGLYHQPPQPYEMYQPGVENQLDYESAISGTLGLEQRFGQAWDFDVEGFYKHLYGLITSNESFSSMSDSAFENRAIGRIYGMELMIKRQPVDRFSGWLSYTLSRSERNYDPLGDGEWHPYEMDQTHILVLVAAYRLPYDFELSTRIQYTTGNPTTPYSGGVYDIDQDYYTPYRTGEWASERLPPYFSADFRVEKLFTWKSWQLSAYVDFLNAIRGVNPEFQRYNYDYTESTWVRGLPFIPNPGFEAEFHF